MLKLIPSKFATTYCVYQLTYTSDNSAAFVWYDKAGDMLTFTQAYSNPAFNVDDEYIFTVLNWCNTKTEAQNAMYRIIQRDGMPDLNKTLKYNRFGAVVCNQTGVIYRNASTAAQSLGLDQSRLSGHLQRRRGHKTIKGLTFSYASKPETSIIYP